MLMIRNGFYGAFVVLSATVKTCNKNFFVGVPNLITSSMIKPGACIIDVGISRLKDGTAGKMRLTGDVNFNGKDVILLKLSAFKGSSPYSSNYPFFFSFANRG